VTNSKKSLELIAFCGGIVSTSDVFYVNLSCMEANLNKFVFGK